MDKAKTFRQYIISLNIFFYGITGIIVFLTLLTIYLIENKPLVRSDTLDIIFKYALPILTFGLIMVSLILYKKILKTIKEADGIEEKLTKFKNAYKFKFSLMDAVSIYSLTACFGTGSFQYLILLLFANIIKFMSKPSEANILSALKMSESDKSFMEDSGNYIVPVKEKPLLISYPILAVVLVSFTLYSSYDIILGLIKKQEWTEEEKSKMVKDCILKAKDTAEKYPLEVKSYCECTNEAIVRKFSRKEIWENNQLSSDDLMKTMSPVFAECLGELKSRIKAKERMNNE